jgi:hypothetical protein
VNDIRTLVIGAGGHAASEALADEPEGRALHGEVVDGFHRRGRERIE